MKSPENSAKSLKHLREAMNPTSPYLTVQEVAAHYKVSAVTVRRWIAEKRIPHENIGRGSRPTYRIPVGAVLQKRFEKPTRQMF